MATPPKYPPTSAPIANPQDGFKVDRTWLAFFNSLVNQAAAAGSGTVTHTGTLTVNHLLLGNGGEDIKALGAVGTSTTVLHGNAAGTPTFSAVDLAADVTGDLPYANLTPATAANRLLGRGSAGGAGDWQPISLGSGLTMSGTSLSATGGGGGGSWIPLVDGSEPPNFITDGAGHLLLVAYP